jgi:hypothetical protein
MNTENVMAGLEVMGKGMLGIFIALAIIYLAVLLLNKLFPEKKKDIPAIESDSDDSEE